MSYLQCKFCLCAQALTYNTIIHPLVVAEIKVMYLCTRVVGIKLTAAANYTVSLACQRYTALLTQHSVLLQYNKKGTLH